MMGALSIVVMLMMTTDAFKISDAEYGKLPRLYHLDDYEWCLLQPRPLYCLGTFRLSPHSQPSPVFDLIQRYSKDHRHFNRALLHRGYCVSSRCPLTTSSSGASVGANTSSRFEACVQQEMKSYSLRASLQMTNYCRSIEGEIVSRMDMPRLVFLIVVGVILMMNMLGTIWDLNGGEKKGELLCSAWSVRANWDRLTATHKDPHFTALAPIQGARIFMLTLVLLSHACHVQQKFYLNNPHFFEQVQHHPMTMLILNGNSMIQVFVVISNFLYAYSMLLSLRNRHHSITGLLLGLLHRMSSIHLLMVGFAATWWRDLGSGPLWDPIVGAESDICREKFWTHALYINNFVRGDDNCMIHTWYLAMDMQLFVVASLVMLLTTRLGRHALPFLAFLFIIACIINAVLAYIYGWKSLMYFITPNHLVNTFRGVSSFTNFYIMPWGSLPACLLGVFVGHLHFEIQKQGYKLTKHKWLMRACVWSIPLLILWVLSGHLVRDHTSRVVSVAFLALERPLFVIITSIFLLGNINYVDNFQRRLLSWRGFRALGRLSLSMLMLHWCINTLLVASRPITQASILSLVSDTVTTGFLSYVLAVPLTILVEYPIQKTFTALIMA